MKAAFDLIWMDELESNPTLTEEDKWFLMNPRKFGLDMEFKGIFEGLDSAQSVVLEKPAYTCPYPQKKGKKGKTRKW
jgi:hypothetical protein